MNEIKKRPLSVSAAKAGLSEKTARKYLRSGILPSESKPAHTWRTRIDPFAAINDELMSLLKNPSLRGTTLFDYLQRTHPGEFDYGQLRTLQRRVKVWRATVGPDQEVYFEQTHIPGDLSQSDFCHMNNLGVTIERMPFAHMIYHFVMTYSNWEYAQVCFSESFEALCDGFQNAVWVLGGVPVRHRTDSLSAAVINLGNKEEFTARYQGLMDHYGVAAEHIQPRRPNENGDVEQSHYRFVDRVDQALMLRGSRDFSSREEYCAFLREQTTLANGNRNRPRKCCPKHGTAASPANGVELPDAVPLGRVSQDQAALGALSAHRYDGNKELDARVGPGSTIKVLHNVYSVHSRLIGEKVKVKVGMDQINVHYGQSVVAVLPRLRGRGNHRIDYRHIIDTLIRKPGAFDQYVFREALFPTSQFRIAYDALTSSRPVEGKKEYLTILKLAADEGQSRVEDALRALLFTEAPLSAKLVKDAVMSSIAPYRPQDVCVAAVDLSGYDRLLTGDYGVPAIEEHFGTTAVGRSAPYATTIAGHAVMIGEVGHE